MAAGAKQPPQPRKRTRKRKRRVASSSSSSSSSSSDSSSSDDENPSTVKTRVPVKSAPPPPPEQSDSESSSSDDSTSSSESDVDVRKNVPKSTTQVPMEVDSVEQQKAARRPRSPSPPLPQPAEIPSFLLSKGDDENDQVQKQEQEMKEKFKKFWMSTLVDAFEDDLKEIQKEPNMNPSRLALLIDSLASGSEVFSSSVAHAETEDHSNDMEIVLGVSE
ncbi:hypothetical protein C8Q75DRAFT_809176 [Abortiporus biennis]|nr:hypothetical protein C8Q75DRAFT_809176 [Abortiporus biennis]